MCVCVCDCVLCVCMCMRQCHRTMGLSPQPDAPPPHSPPTTTTSESHILQKRTQPPPSTPTTTAHAGLRTTRARSLHCPKPCQARGVHCFGGTAMAPGVRGRCVWGPHPCTGCVRRNRTRWVDWRVPVQLETVHALSCVCVTAHSKVHCGGSDGPNSVHSVLRTHVAWRGGLSCPVAVS